MSNGVHSYVTKVQQTTGNRIQLTVKLAYINPDEVVEVSGQATQDNGAFAPFYVVKATAATDPNAAPGSGTTYAAPGSGTTYAAPGTVSYLTVTADSVGDNDFDLNQPVTVVVRVSKVWGTVLSTANADPQVRDAIPEWGMVDKVAEIKPFKSD